MVAFGFCDVLHTEGVDRNSTGDYIIKGEVTDVLLTEDVDRNNDDMVNDANEMRRPHTGDEDRNVEDYTRILIDM